LEICAYCNPRLELNVRALLFLPDVKVALFILVRVFPLPVESVKSSKFQKANKPRDNASGTGGAGVVVVVDVVGLQLFKHTVIERVIGTSLLAISIVDIFAL
jgi:hypothetical protein